MLNVNILDLFLLRYESALNECLKLLHLLKCVEVRKIVHYKKKNYVRTFYVCKYEVNEFIRTINKYNNCINLHLNFVYAV